MLETGNRGAGEDGAACLPFTPTRSQGLSQGKHEPKDSSSDSSDPAKKPSSPRALSAAQTPLAGFTLTGRWPDLAGEYRVATHLVPCQVTQAPGVSTHSTLIFSVML